MSAMFVERLNLGYILHTSRTAYTYLYKLIIVMINGHRVEHVRQFVYVGSVITEDCKCHEEVKRRIAIGKRSIQ